MVSFLYAVCAFTCALVLIILPIKIRKFLDRSKPAENAFLNLINWTSTFCILDTAWGVFASDVVMNDALLFFFSTLFHLGAAVTPLMWLYYVLTYLEVKKSHKIVFESLTFAAFLGEIGLLIANFFTKHIFFVNELREYETGPTRRILFYLQYATYILIFVACLVMYFSVGDKHIDSSDLEAGEKRSYRSVLAFVASPILAGIFQQIYPDAPAYSIGYTLGCCVIYSFVITDTINRKIAEDAILKEANRAKTSFLFNMSHDIRTPMNAIVGFTNIALKHIEDRDKVVDSLEKTKQSSDLLLSLINSILDMSRIESGKATVEHDKVDIYESFTVIESTMNELAKTKDIDLNFEIGEIKDRYVYCDHNRCLRVFVNIISNAVKYTLDGGKVTAKCEQIGKENGKGIYRYTFSDTGIGMSEEFQKHVFEEFSRERNSTTSGIQGTGLGLAVCKSFTELMGGTIECRSKQGAGTTFIVTFPFEIREKDETEEVTVAVTGSEFDFKGKKVLLVEDNEMNREIAGEILGEEGIIIEEAEDGNIAVDILKEKGPDYYDFILMDIQMPIMNGYEATKMIRSMYPDSNIKIIALSANAFAEDKAASIAAGMNDHVAKPINVEELNKVMAKYA